MDSKNFSRESIPDKPGVYIYKDIHTSILYVGKAANLRKRVSQYFLGDDAIGEKTDLLVPQIHSIETIPTVSEFDALLLEAKLIRENKPKYNSIAKDDKSPIYLYITTSDVLPRVLAMRRTNLPPEAEKRGAVFGPFQSSRVVYSLLRQLRTIIPYCTEKRRTGKPCFYTHLGLCAPCASVISAMDDSPQKKELIHAYRTNIFRLKDLLSGKSTAVVNIIEQEMRTAAKNEQFELAATLKERMASLYRLLEKRYDPSLYINTQSGASSLYNDETNTLVQVLSPFFPAMKALTRIECIDISNTFGTYATGSLVVLTNGQIDTSQYRHFRIRRDPKAGPNDFAMIAEVTKRRFAHPEWPAPDLFIVDGGKGQVAAAREVFEQLELTIPLVGLAKRFEEIVIPTPKGVQIVRISLSSPAIHVMQRIRDEAHRFAIAYHKKLRGKAFLDSK